LARGVLRYGGKFPTLEFSRKVGNVPPAGHIHAPRGEFWVDLWPTKVTESTERVLLRFYQLLVSLGAGVVSGLLRVCGDDILG
jgi:hypothetical protein